MDRAEMVQALRLLVEAESFSTDPDGLERCAGMIDDLCRTVLGTGTTPAGAHRVWRRNGDRPVLLLCHFDTVWPPGTLAAFPFEVPDGPVTVLFTADEEIGSPTSRPLIEDEARGAGAVLVLEPAARTAVKIARKGTGTYRVEVTGRAAHAGLAPEDGVNAAVELARQVEGIGGLADPAAGENPPRGQVRAGN